MNLFPYFNRTRFLKPFISLNLCSEGSGYAPIEGKQKSSPKGSFKKIRY
jgi:hypothetical protein